MKHVLRHTRALLARETTQRDHWRGPRAPKQDSANPGQERDRWIDRLHLFQPAWLMRWQVVTLVLSIEVQKDKAVAATRMEASGTGRKTGPRAPTGSGGPGSLRAPGWGVAAWPLPRPPAPSPLSGPPPSALPALQASHGRRVGGPSARRAAPGGPGAPGRGPRSARRRVLGPAGPPLALSRAPAAAVVRRCVARRRKATFARRRACRPLLVLTVLLQDGQAEKAGCQRSDCMKASTAWPRHV